MTADAYMRWLEPTIQEYAQEHVDAGNWSADQALDQARRQFAELLPAGRETAGHADISVAACREAVEHRLIPRFFLRTQTIGFGPEFVNRTQ